MPRPFLLNGAWASSPLSFEVWAPSGLGREGPRYAMEEFTERRVLVLDR